jgi:hypothetical protein
MVALALFFVKRMQYKGFVDKIALTFQNMVQPQTFYGYWHEVPLLPRCG